MFFHIFYFGDRHTDRSRMFGYFNKKGGARMVSILIRTLLIYFFLIAIMRLMGKRQIGELEVTDLVTTLLISEIASLPITEQDIPISFALIPMTTLLCLEIFSSIILIRFPRCKTLVSARPTTIVRGGILDQRALRSLRISMEELMSELRQQGYPSLDQISDAILEKNGKLTVLPKAKYAQPNLSDLRIKGTDPSLMHVVLSNGKCNEAGLNLIGKDRAWLLRELQKRGYSAKSLFCATANESGELLLIPLQTKKGNKQS